MIKTFVPGIAILAAMICTSCNNQKQESEKAPVDTVASTTNQTAILPEPHATKSVKNYSKVVGWPIGTTPVAPEGFEVTKFADELQNPRWIYIGPNGDIFVSEANTESKGAAKVKDKVTGKAESQNMGTSANRITLLRDTNKDGTPEVRSVFLSGLNQPFGMLILNNYFYVANTDGLWRFPYKTGATSIKAKGEMIVPLPAGGYNNHWTRNVIANADRTRLYIAVGSGSNNGENGMEHEYQRANILEANPDGTGLRVYAGGLRNPVGIDLQPGTNTLWAAVNERDDLGDGLVPDYATSVKEGGFYGWPYTYFGNHDDPGVELPLPDSIRNVIVPDIALDAHSASLGFTFYDAKAFPEKYHNGAFIGQHGSWNSSKFTGYKVVFIPFQNNKPGTPEDFLTGFIKDENAKEVYGRPVGVTVASDGALLVADDAANTIWRVSLIGSR
jgi:glucose/arabinose dehydrogenase